MEADLDVRPCICAKLWGLDFSKPQHGVVCLCGAKVYVHGGSSWFLQHGENPEHRSPDYDGGDLIAACDWIDAVCLESRAGTEGRNA